MSLQHASLLVLTLAGATAQAQDHHPAPQRPHAAAPGPYAGLQQREVKALSAQQVEELQAGRGMSLALAAELNGYPGPSHVLALAEALALSPAQQARTQALFGQMQQEARLNGAAVLAAERALDALFSQQQATPQTLAAATAEAARAQGQLRESHLRYHLAMRALLTPGQVAAYNRLRGY